jgi:hypothetical protein
MERRPNFQTIAWFNDLRQRGNLDLNPPYQRRSIWNQNFKDYFIDTVLLNLPAPAIFLYEDISPEGRSLHHVVDGKQRLTTIFEFIDGEFPVHERSQIESLRGSYFTGLPPEVKRKFWSYVLLVEYVPSDDEEGIKAIFDRINRNVAKLTPQELRHARFEGAFISTAESLGEWSEATLPPNFPRIVQPSKRQMKDVELVSLLLLLTEEGVRTYAQPDLDEAYSDRDESWEKRHEVETRFREIVSLINQLIRDDTGEPVLAGTRLRNQADFYSLYGALLELAREHNLPPVDQMRSRLAAFVSALEGEPAGPHAGDFVAYLDAARSASNDRGPRETRIRIVKRALLGEL